MIAYLLKSATCLALLLVFYYLVLEREKMHNFNRFYLLGSVFFSFLAPLYIIYIEATPIIFEAAKNTSVFHTAAIGTTKIIPEKPFNYFSILIGFYSLISFILLFRFAKNLFNIIQKTRNNSKIKYQKAVLVLVDDKILPHTFWNFIFINKKEYEEKKIEQELFTHELTHVNQKHTLDILILEFIQCLFWINPFIILLKKSVQLNHEFLADETVINEHKNIFQYQHLLLNKTAWNNKYYLASNLNYSLTKKRLKMMTTQSSRTKIWIKKLAVIPLLAGFIFLFAERVEAQEIIDIAEEPIETIVEETLKQEKLSKKELNDYNSLAKKYNTKSKENSIIKLKDLNLLQYFYFNMSKDQRKNAENFPEYLPQMPAAKKFTPSKKQFKDFLNNEKYGIWIDGKKIENKKLNNYQNTDFPYYSKSYVYKNAKSKKHPQEYQVSLYTHPYYRTIKEKNKDEFENWKTNFKKNGVIEESEDEPDNIEIIEIIESITKKYDQISYQELNSIYESKRNGKPHFVESSEKRQTELIKLFSQLGSLYFKLSKKYKKKVKRPIHPHHPYLRLMKNNKVFYKLRTDLTKEDKLLIPPPPPVPDASKEEILKAKKAYDAWKERTGNDFAVPPPPPPKKSKKKIENKDKLGLTNKLKKLFGKAPFEFEKLEKDKKSNYTYYLDYKKTTLETVNQEEKTQNIKSVLVVDKNIYVTTKKTESN